MPKRRSLHSNTIRRSRVGTAQLCRLVNGEGSGRRALCEAARPINRPCALARAGVQGDIPPMRHRKLAYSRADAAEADDRTSIGSFRAVAKKPSFQLLTPRFTLPLLHLSPRQAARATSSETRPVMRLGQPKFRRDNRASDQLPPIHTNRIQTNRIQSKSGRGRGPLRALLP